jgi:hypothetical protein
MIRIGAFDRLPGHRHPHRHRLGRSRKPEALEYLLRGDVATVSVQYSYLASWLALLADPAYGIETARAVFARVYDHWRSLPTRDAAEALPAWPQPGIVQLGPQP